MRLITDVLREIRKGRVVDQASEVLAEVTRAVDVTQKPGEVTIKIKVEPAKGGGSQKVLTAKVSCKKPLEDLPQGIFYSNADGDLVRNDPDQGDLVRTLEAEGGPPRKASELADPRRAN